jgi:sugar phosphate isomerase/epimerase
MIWGYAGIWHGDYRVWEAEDVVLGRLEFVARNGFRSTGLNLKELDDPARRDRVVAFVAEHDLRIAPHTGFAGAIRDPDAFGAECDAFLERLERDREALRIPIVTGGAGPVHRFMADPCLEEQLDRLAVGLEGLAAECARLGCPLGIENHGDYYCSDLAELCRRVPHLGIFFDTGNTYLIGERPLPAAREAAPHTIGTHFKDHVVFPDPKTLTFHITGACLGEGHVRLREIWDILMAYAPDPENLVMHWELVPPRDMGGLEALERSWKFIRALPGASCDEGETR